MAVNVFVQLQVNSHHTVQVEHLESYVRTGAGKLEEVPQIRAELARIASDYEFVTTDLTWEKAARRIEEYKNFFPLNILVYF